MMPVSRKSCDKERRELDLVASLALATKSTTRSQEVEKSIVVIAQPGK